MNSKAQIVGDLLTPFNVGDIVEVLPAWGRSVTFADLWHSPAKNMICNSDYRRRQLAVGRRGEVRRVWVEDGCSELAIKLLEPYRPAHGARGAKGHDMTWLNITSQYVKRVWNIRVEHVNSILVPPSWRR